MNRSILFACAFFIAIPFEASAQQGPDLEQLRQQLQLIQAQIDAATTASSVQAQRSNVTQIGGPRRHTRDGGLVVRIYDLGDLFAVAPPYAATTEGDLAEIKRVVFGQQPHTYSGGGGLGGGGFFNLAPQHLNPVRPEQHVANQAGTNTQVRTSQDQLIKTIKQTINPDGWDDNGGEATVAQLGNAFIISADEHTHSQIDALMNLFRERWGTLRTISVRAWWVWMTPAEIAPVLNSDGEPVQPDDAPAFGLVPDDAWAEILSKWSDAEEDRPRGYQATLTCYNGQTVHTISGDQGLAVTGIRPVVVKDENDQKVGRIAYRPDLSIVHEGLAFQITPISNVSGRTLLLDLHSRITTPVHEAKVMEQAEKIGDEPTPEQVVDVIDSRRLNVHRLSTTIRVPVNRPMLVGGMSATGHPHSADKYNLYLFVKTSVQELRNDRDEEPVKAELEEAPAEE